MSAINPTSQTLPTQNLDAQGATAVASLERSPGTDAEATQQVVEAARQFEAIFLRQILSTLERGGKLFGDSDVAGSGVYGSFMVDALADHTASAGGLGLSELILKALMPPPSTDSTGSVSEP